MRRDCIESIDLHEAYAGIFGFGGSHPPVRTGMLEGKQSRPPRIHMTPKTPLPLEHWISYRFGLLGSRVGAVLSPMYTEQHDLPMTAWRSLAVIARYGPLSAGELGARTSTDSFKVARSIQLLVKRALVTRQADPADRRRARLQLTKRGRAIHCEIAKVAAAIEEYLVAGLTQQERKFLDETLVKIDARVEALAEAGWEVFAPKTQRPG